MKLGGRGRAGRAITLMVGIPFASWRYLSREIEIHRDEATSPWPIEGFPDDDRGHAGDRRMLRPAQGCGPAFRRRYRVRVERPLVEAERLMAIVANDPNVACPLEIADFKRESARGGPIEVGEEMVVRLPGPWNGPVRVVDAGPRSFRLATLQGHMEAGEIEFRARDGPGELVFDIESWARSSDPLFDMLYGRLGFARELQLDMWAFFLERVAQISGGVASHGIELYTRRCDSHPFRGASHRHSRLRLR